MITHQRWRLVLAGLAAAWSLLACGGGGSGSAPVVSQPTSILPQEPGAPASVNNISADGLNWINYRRGQIGMPVLAPNAVIAKAAQGHADYQKLNNDITHDEVAGKPGYTGSDLLQRLNAAGYSFGNNSYAS
ncbi:MAG TPA: CAP domain-containing protein, partial [Telluria sp.]|nr:CAP domain-containing protein [Telluria sp.]